MEAVLILAIGFVCMACFLMGAKVGQKVVKGEPVELPNPVKAIEKHQAEKEAKYEQSKREIILRNIENYDGTAYGQTEVPRG